MSAEAARMVAGINGDKRGPPLRRFHVVEAWANRIPSFRMFEEALVKLVGYFDFEGLAVIFLRSLATSASSDSSIRQSLSAPETLPVLPVVSSC